MREPIVKLEPFKLLKFFLPNSFYGRFLLILLLPILSISLITMFVFIDRHWESVTNLLADNIGGNVAATMTLLERPGSHKSEVIHFAKQNFNLIVSFPPSQHHSQPKSALTLKVGKSFLKKALDRHLSYPYKISLYEDVVKISVLSPQGTVLFSMPRKRLLTKATPIFFMWAVGSPIFFFIIAWLFMRNQIRPIRRLSYAADRFGKGREVKHFKPEGSYELRRAGRAFLKMKERLERQISQRTEMLAGVSHDLRTPLTRMELHLALLKESIDVKDLRKDVGEMTKMVESFLAFARGDESEPSQEVDIYVLITDLISAYTPLFKGEIQFIGRKGLKLELRVQSMKRCLSNLIENAMRFASIITVKAERGEGHIFISIEDDGPGVPQKKRESVFKPFYRLDRSRNLDEGNVGLGLTIARDAARQQGGNVTLDTSSSGGLKAVVKLPL